MDRYSLTPRRRRLVRLLALAFLLLGIHRTATLALPLVAPQYMRVDVMIDEGRVEPDPMALLPEDARASAFANPSERALVMATLEEPDARMKLFLITIVTRAPWLALMFSLAIALWRATGRSPGAALSGVPWLVRAGWASVAAAVATPVGEALTGALLLRDVIPDDGIFTFDVDLDVVQNHLLLAAGALAAAWTIAAGLRARADIEEIV